MFKREKSLMLFNLDSDQFSFRGIWLFLFVYLGATIFAAIMTAPAFWTVQWYDSINPSETTKWLLGKNVGVYFDRMRWVPIVIGLPWVLAKCGLFSLKNLGINFSLKSLATFGRYFLFGLVLAGIIFSAQFAFGISKVKTGFDSSDLISCATTAIFASLILAFLEELIFRGLIFRVCYCFSQPIIAALLCSLFFAYKHFKITGNFMNLLPGGGHTAPWDVGWFFAYYDAVAIGSCFHFVQFASLAMFGMLLCAIYVRTKTLLAPIATHAALVFMIQTYRSAFDISTTEMTKYLGNAGMTNGIFPLCLLTILFLIVVFAKFGKRKNA